MSVVTSAMCLNEEEPKDRPFYPSRRAKTATAESIVEEALERMQRYERLAGARTRARKPLDQQRFEEQVEALLCDLMHRELTTPGGWIAVSFSKTVLGRNDRYSSKVLSKTLPAVIRVMAQPAVGLVDLEIGSRHPTDPALSRQTVICAGPQLRAWMQEHDLGYRDFCRLNGDETIILKSGKVDFFDTAKLLPYKDTAQTTAFRAQMQRVNQSLEHGRSQPQE